MPFSKISLRGLRAILCLFKFFSNIREGLGNEMRVENNYSILGRWSHAKSYHMLGLGI
jgi:hypothetical protein